MPATATARSTTTPRHIAYPAVASMARPRISSWRLAQRKPRRSGVFVINAADAGLRRQANRVYSAAFFSAPLLSGGVTPSVASNRPSLPTMR